MHSTLHKSIYFRQVCENARFFISTTVEGRTTFLIGVYENASSPIDSTPSGIRISFSWPRYATNLVKERPSFVRAWGLSFLLFATRISYQIFTGKCKSKFNWKLGHADEKLDCVISSCDDIIIATGLRPNRDQAYAFYDLPCSVHMIGDCTNVGRIRDANEDAYYLASNI
ncbi:Uncharacterised protein [uncultured Clostridium sp.]|nr:Uncharacterised protein [uncultured Clostridium sp.]